MSVLVVSGSTTVALNEPLWYPGANLSLGTASLVASDLADPDYVWRTQPSVRTVVGFLARNIAQIGLHAFSIQDDGDRQRLDRSAPLSRVLRHPGGVPTKGRPATGATAFRHMRDLVTDMCLWDRHACLKVLDPSGSVTLRRLPPRQWQFKRDALDQPTGVAYSPAGVGGVLTIPLESLLWVDGYPTPDGLVTSPMEALNGILTEQSEAAAYRAELWQNGARFSGWVERPLDAPEWSKTARANWKATIAADFTGGGSRAGGLPLFEEGMVYHPEAGITPEQAQQIESRKLSISEVAAYYYVPPVFVGILDNANYSNVSAYRQMLYSDVLGSLLREIEGAYQDRLVPDLADPDAEFVEFNVGEKLRLSFEEQAVVLQTATGGPIMTRNEARQRVNLQRIDTPEYDELVVPLNVITGGQASPTDTQP